MSSKHNIDFIKKFFENKGCRLLVNEYVNNKTKMPYICSCGNESIVNFHCFKRMKGCRNCSFKYNSGIKHNFTYVCDYFKEQGCELLEKEYVNANTSMQYRCSCGVVSKTNFGRFKIGQRCKLCGVKKCSASLRYSWEYVSNYFKQQGCKLLSSEYVNANSKLNYRCSCGEVSTICFSSFSQGQRCKKCGFKKNSGPRHAKWNPNKWQIKLNEKIGWKCSKMLYRCLEKFSKNKGDRTHELLGYTNSELRDHITNHPNWENVKNSNWEIDHIFPIKAFVFYNVCDLKLINALDNLRPILAGDNHKKAGKYDLDEFKSWLQTKGVTI